MHTFLYWSSRMPNEETTTLTVRVRGVLRDHVTASVGSSGNFENVSEYLRDLIRSDKARKEQQAFRRLKAELTHAYAAPETSYQPLTAADIIQRNRD